MSTEPFHGAMPGLLLAERTSTPFSPFVSGLVSLPPGSANGDETVKVWPPTTSMILMVEFNPMERAVENGTFPVARNVAGSAPEFPFVSQSKEITFVGSPSAALDANASTPPLMWITLPLPPKSLVLFAKTKVPEPVFRKVSWAAALAPPVSFPESVRPCTTLDAVAFTTLRMLAPFIVARPVNSTPEPALF